MQFFTTLALLASSFTLASAAPTADSTDATPKPRSFYLQAHTINKKEGTGHAPFNGTYLAPYHTGAGFNDVSFTPTKYYPAILNNTGLQLLIPNSGPYYTHFSFAETYASWDSVSINIGAPTPQNDGTFFLNATGLQSNSSSFAGWRICEWWHGKAQPQLFYNKAFYEKFVPSNCELVNLLPVYA